LSLAKNISSTPAAWANRVTETAGYCIYDVENELVELLRIKYDLATAQKKITKAGLPRLLAERLAMGR
jgi:hypothetical protein